MVKLSRCLRLIALAFLLQLGCSAGDDDSPARIEDLVFMPGTRLVLWTAPGDDGQSGRATVYDLRFFEASEIAALLGLSSLEGVSFSTIFETLINNFEVATQIQGEPRPEAAGTAQDFVIDRLDILGTTRFFFALNARDEVGNNSGPSNVVEVETPLTSAEFRFAEPGSCFGDSVASGDFSGDSINDILIGDPCRGMVFLFLGRNDLASSELSGGDGVFDLAAGDSADTVIIGNAADGFGTALSSIASFSGDRSREFAIGAPLFNGETGRVYIFEGDEELPSTIDLNAGEVSPLVTIDGENPGDMFGAALADAERVEGGLRRGLLVGAPGFGSSAGRVYLFRAGDLDEEASATDAKGVIDGEGSGDMLGFAIAVAGEVNEEDSLRDFALGAPGSGKVFLIFGESDFPGIDLGADLSKVTVFSGSAADGFGTSLAGGGDLDGFIDPDMPEPGPSDLVVGVPGDDMGRGAVLLFSGDDIAGARGTGATPPVASRLSGLSPGDNFGASVAVLGDVNPGIDRVERDEGIILGQIVTNDDFVVGAPGTANGSVFLFFGSDSLPSELSASDADIVVEGTSPGGEFGRLVTSVGDVTGDFQNDFAVSGEGVVEVEF